MEPGSSADAYAMRKLVAFCIDKGLLAGAKVKINISRNRENVKDLDNIDLSDEHIEQFINETKGN